MPYGADRLVDSLVPVAMCSSSTRRPVPLRFTPGTWVPGSTGSAGRWMDRCTKPWCRLSG